MKKYLLAAFAVFAFSPAFAQSAGFRLGKWTEIQNAIIKELKNHYDYIVLDTAPVGLVNDSLQLGRLANLCIYVCRADYTPKTSFGMINGLNAEKKLPNMCLVLNGVDLTKKKYGYYYGYGKYGKYGKYGNYGNYGNYGKYGSYGQYGSYGNYSNSHYGNANDTSIKM